MQTVKGKLEQYLNLPIDKEHQQGFSVGFKKGVQFTQKWFSLNEEKPSGINLLFKNNMGNYAVGKFDFIESKLCIVTDSSYSLIEDSGFTHFRPIDYPIL